MKLTEREANIYLASQFHADRSATSFRKQLGYREHSVRYAIHKLTAAGIIRKRPLVNFSLLGLMDFVLYLSVSHKDDAAKTKFDEFLSSSGQTGVVFESGGDFQYYISFFVKDYGGVQQFLTEISKFKGTTCLSRAVAVPIQYTLFQRRYLSKRPWPDSEALSFRRATEQVKVDQLDLDIIAGLDSNRCRSYRELASLVRAPHSTVQTRIRRLTEAGVMAGQVYGMLVNKLGIQIFRVLISLRTTDRANAAKLSRFCAAHPNIVVLVELLGSWDFEIQVEVPDAKETVMVVQSLHQALGSELISTKIIPMFGYLKVSHVPAQVSSIR